MTDTERKLLSIYEEWTKELYKLGFDNEIYSHPHYISVPCEWEQKDKAKIMIVGEEGYGEKRLYGDIEKIQNALAQQYEHLTKNGSSKFWQRFKILQGLGCCIWNNLDKVHRRGVGKCQLRSEERSLLHSTNIKILAKEIEILKPEVVVFFGWYGESVKKELPNIFQSLYPKGLGCNIAWADEKYFSIVDNGISYIFTYHPSWRGKPKEYEATICDIIKNHIKNLDN